MRRRRRERERQARDVHAETMHLVSVSLDDLLSTAADAHALPATCVFFRDES